jgi:hypothetical protein
MGTITKEEFTKLNEKLNSILKVLKIHNDVLFKVVKLIEKEENRKWMTKDE